MSSMFTILNNFFYHWSYTNKPFIFFLAALLQIIQGIELTKRVKKLAWLIRTFETKQCKFLFYYILIRKLMIFKFGFILLAFTVEAV